MSPSGLALSSPTKARFGNGRSGLSFFPHPAQIVGETFPALMLAFVRLSVALLTLAFAASARAEFTIVSTNYVIVGPSAEGLPFRQAQLEWSARVFETLMGVRPPRGRVVLTDTPSGSVLSMSGDTAALVNTIPMTRQPPAADGSLWNLSWFNNERAPGGRGPTFSAMTHEAAHLQLVMTVNFNASDALRAAFNGYGSFLPDWLDEAVAVYHEPESLKRVRRERFNPNVRIPLKTFFTMSHPGTPSAPQVISIEAKTPEEARKKFAAFKQSQHAALQKTAESLKADSVSVDLFYSQALAVIEYMTARGGLPYFRFMLVGQNFGKSLDQILLEWGTKNREIAQQRAAVESAAAGRTPPPRKIEPSDKMGPPPPRANKVAGVLVRAGEAVNQMPPSVEVMEADFVNWIVKNYPKYRPPIPPYPGK